MRPTSTSPRAAKDVPAPGTTEGRLHRSLSLRHLVVYGLLFIGPTAPMGTFGVLDARSNGAVALVFLVATVAMAFTAWSYARMSVAVPKAGSVSAYATAGLGRRPGFMAGWMIGLDYLFIPSLAALFCGIASHALFPAVPVWVFTGAAVLLITGLNLGGVKLAATVGFVALVVEILVLAAFCVGAVVVLVQEGPARPWLSPLTGLDGFTVAGTLGAVSVAALAFLGFDAIATFAEETTGSPRQVSKALIFCLVLAGALFVLQTYLGALLTTTTPAELAARPDEQGTVFYTMIGDEIGSWLGTTVTTARAIGPVLSALVAQAAVSRLMYGMARDGQLPAALGSVSRRTGVPRPAILVSAVATLLIAVAAAIKPDGLDLLSSMVTVGALAAFVFLHVAVIGYYVLGRRTDRRVLHTVVPVVGAAIVVAVLVLASHLALEIAAVWLVVGLVIMVVRARRGPGAPTHDVATDTGPRRGV
ncbi:APC family permease [Isoptericola sp. BMS4]|uniref:APC family permease n=1 Tax=Isoptericola sp. BMS4 TaxID=2527875 RepID=UPI001F0DC254|nr:APC family permease [Isoptericola sp. BMS4]